MQRLILISVMATLPSLALAQSQPTAPTARPGAIQPASPAPAANADRPPLGGIAAQLLRPGSIPPPDDAAINDPPAVSEPLTAPAGRRFDQQRMLGSRPPTVMDRTPTFVRPPVAPKPPVVAAPIKTGSVVQPQVRPAPASAQHRGAILTCPPGTRVKVLGNSASCE